MFNVERQQVSKHDYGTNNLIVIGTKNEILAADVIELKKPNTFAQQVEPVYEQSLTKARFEIY
jgi:hypothetical protein